MSRKWIQLLVLEAVVLIVVVSLLPGRNKSTTSAWEPVQWRTETTPAPRPAYPSRQSVAGAANRRALDQIPAPPADSYYAPRFEGAAPIADPAAIPEVQRTEYVRQRLSRTGADFGAIVNRTLRSSLPPDWDGEALASNRQIRYPTDNWPRR